MFASSKQNFPVNTGHRGFNGKYPENTLASFEAAIDAGAEIIEFDVQVAGDGVVVVSHDPNTQRCFGVNHEITSTPFKGVLDQLSIANPDLTKLDEGNVDDTKSENTTYTYEQQAELSAIMQKKARNLTISQHMPTFLEVAQKFATDPKFRNIGLMIDIKMTNEPWIVKKIVNVLKQVNPDLAGYWAPRTVLGIWRLDVLREAGVVARPFSIVHIGVSRSLARQFIAMPQVCAVSLHHIALSAGASGEAFIQEIKSQGRYIYTWTVNSLDLMKWAVASDLDGVITDYPDIYAQLRAGLTDDQIKRHYAPATAAHAFIPWIDRNVKNIFFYYMIEIMMLGKMSLLYFTSGRKDT
ncbi:hypothetical protein D0Z00_003818 [Geotrichum galactomycetum]|uniref:Uncharacterized protein n=1 Tax=Geotrichum galactomycetum TaxID=27317 RepID=A0ACB6V0B5_9ASCO|nr:hypothetical protein D0Z00_003818 [Geotrichum candidum]